MSAEAKPGPDDPCPCGSNLKYVRCHGSIVDPNARHGNLALDATDTRAMLVGFPGQHQEFHVRNVFAPGDPNDGVPPLGEWADYEVIFVLQRPGFPLKPERQLSFSSGLAGDSHLAISKPSSEPPRPEDVHKVLIIGDSGQGHIEFDCHPNERGFMGKIVSRPFRAENRHLAEGMAYRAIAPALSFFSVSLDMPLQVAQSETTDLRTKNVHVRFVAPFLEAQLSAIELDAKMSPEFRGFASLYREGLNSNSPVYQFLCFFKIIDALRARRTRLTREAQRAGRPYTRPSEMFPTSNAAKVEWLNALFSGRAEWDLMSLGSAVPNDVEGKPIEAVVNDLLRPLRNNAAHAFFLDEGGELSLSSDDLLNTAQITRRLILTKCIVRRMLKNDFPSSFLGH